MQPTCIGISSTRSVTLRNTARIPVMFSCAVPARYAGIFSIAPTAGVLLGNDTAELTVAFAPRQQSLHKFDLPFKVSQSIS